MLIRLMVCSFSLFGGLGGKREDGRRRMGCWRVEDGEVRLGGL